MEKEKIFITGASGCIGHYIIDQFLYNPNYELHLLLRNPSRLQFDYTQFPQIKIHKGDMNTIEKQMDILAQMNYVIHTATAWGDSDYSSFINVTQTLKLFDACNPQLCKKIIYFSTASILGKNNKPVKEAETLGTGYIRSKYLAFQKLPEARLHDRIITVFPTLVFGGDKTHPYSHLSSGLNEENAKYLNILRFFYMDATFHFLHANDIALVVKYLLEHSTNQKEYVFGNPVMTGKKTLEELCEHFHKAIYFRIKIPPAFLFLLAKLFKIKVGPWDRFCIENPFFEYTVVNPSTFGLKTEFPNLKHLLQPINV